MSAPHHSWSRGLRAVRGRVGSRGASRHVGMDDDGKDQHL